ncbi:MAG: aminotransferase class I/II-fold pyridoxal phosphate-dependent enzyme [Sphaerobacter sp.]|nr:aminotransferase class I/II-fold pyridoxal phosphate-dependent enzyme [Sphaerobacter sp.]
MSSASPFAPRTRALSQLLERFLQSQTESTYARRQHEPGILDFVLGNPQEPPLPGIAAAIQRWSVPQDSHWFAYKLSEPEAQAAVAAALRERRGIPFAAEDILMTTGAFAGLANALLALAGEGDEVVFISPPWFFYEAMIVAAGATPVRVRMQPDTFDLDLEALAAALSPRTRAVIVNSPHNPTGKIYPPATLERLAALLSEASQRHGRPIYLLSDESYSRIVYDGRPYPSPVASYPRTLVVYTFGKTLLIPGQRLGYIALPPTMPERAEVRLAILLRQVVGGYGFPNAVMQYAVADLEALTIDVAHLQRKRDRMVAALREMGYAVHTPEGTFYLLPRSPWADDLAFTELLATHDIFVLPGAQAEMPGHFRISLTASDEMIDRALPGFAAALAHARTHAPAAADG